MLLLKADVARIWILAALFSLLDQTRLLGQDIPAGDSVRFNYGRMKNHVEVGINALGVGLEYRRQWLPVLSTDALLSLDKPGVGLGITFSPYWIVFVQGVVGTGSYEDVPAADGPAQFKPNYQYGWKVGIHVPVSPTKSGIFFTIAAGQLKFVQNQYQYNGGGLIIGPPPTPLYRTETRTAEVFSVGFGLSF